MKNIILISINKKIESFRLKYLIVPLLFISFCSFILLQSCSVSKSNGNTRLYTLPESYENINDTNNLATLNWKQFFVDSRLISLIDTALSTNFNVPMTLQKIEMAKNDLRLTKGAMLPSVSSNISYLQRKFGYYTMDDAGNRTTEITLGKMVPTNLPDYFVGLQANWEIDVWGKLRNKKKAAFSRYLSSVEGKNFVFTNLISEIASTYYELLAFDMELSIIKETLKLRKDALEIVKIQKEAAALNELAAKQFEAQVLNLQSTEFEIQQQITENEIKLNFLIGRLPQPIIRDTADLVKQVPFLIKPGIPTHLLKNRPDIRQAEFNLLATKFDLKVAEKAFYPSFNITGSIGYQAFNPSFLFTTPKSLAYGLLGNLVTPLINRTAIKMQFNNANAIQLEAMYNYQKTILNG